MVKVPWEIKQDDRVWLAAFEWSGKTSVRRVWHSRLRSQWGASPAVVAGPVFPIGRATSWMNWGAVEDQRRAACVTGVSSTGEGREPGGGIKEAGRGLGWEASPRECGWVRGEFAVSGPGGECGGQGQCPPPDRVGWELLHPYGKEDRSRVHF